MTARRDRALVAFRSSSLCVLLLAACASGEPARRAVEAPRPEGGPSRLRLAAFRADVTPPAGEPLIWTVPLVKAEDPLWAKGVVLEDGADRCVLCAVDWCEIADASHLLFQEKIAAAARTDPSRVAVQCVHQHAAPYADGDAHRLLDQAPDPPLHLSDRFLAEVTDRLAAAVTEAMGRLEPFDRVGVGEAKVDRVASTRRIISGDGKVVVRYSGGAASPELAAAPEGFIDPVLKTVTLARGERPLVRLHYYATHPQTFCCDGRASADFVGAAREMMEKGEGVFQAYFTGCAGDVTAGKYNDGSPGARAGLASRLHAAMEASIASSRFRPAAGMGWRTEPLVLPGRTDPGHSPADRRARLLDPRGPPYSRVYDGAMGIAYEGRRAGRPLTASALAIAGVRILHLPGEPMVEFQRFAQKARPDLFVKDGTVYTLGRVRRGGKVVGDLIEIPAVSDGRYR